MVTGVVASSQYLLQFVSAPVWGRLADKGFPRAMVCAALLAPLIPSVACLFVSAAASERAVIVTFNVATVLSGLCGSPLAVAFAVAKSLIRLRLDDGKADTAARAMLLIMGCVPLGVLTGVGTEKIIEGLRPELAVNATRTLQEQLNPLAITAVVVLGFMIVILLLSGVLSREFSKSLAQLSDGHGTNYDALDDDDGAESDPSHRSCGDSIGDALSRKLLSPSCLGQQCYG